MTSNSRTRRRPARRLAAVALGLALGACAGPENRAPPEGAVALDGGRVRALIEGNALVGAYGADPYTFFFEPGGVVRGTLGLFRGADSGTWRIDGDVYCHRWAEYFGSTERCYRWYDLGEGYLLRNVDAYRWFDIAGRLREGRPPGY